MPLCSEHDVKKVEENNEKNLWNAFNVHCMQMYLWSNGCQCIQSLNFNACFAIQWPFYVIAIGSESNIHWRKCVYDENMFCTTLSCFSSFIFIFCIFFIILIWVSIFWLIFQVKCRLQIHKYPAAEPETYIRSEWFFVVNGQDVLFCCAVAHTHMHTYKFSFSRPVLVLHLCFENFCFFFSLVFLLHLFVVRTKKWTQHITTRNGKIS